VDHPHSLRKGGRMARARIDPYWRQSVSGPVPRRCIATDVDNALRETGLPAGALELEITENVALHHGDALKSLQKLKKAGVKIAFDDFGTGYAP